MKSQISNSAAQPLRTDISLSAQITAQRIIARQGTAGYVEACRWVPEDYVVQLIAQRLRTRWDATGAPLSDADLQTRIADIRARHTR